MTAIRRPPPRATKTLVVAAACATALLLVAVLWMTFMTWPWPTTVCVGLVVGFVCGLILGDRRADLELVYQRKDAAVEGAMDVAFSAQQLEQRISGEHPEGDVEQYDWAAEDDIPELPQPPTYLRRLW